MKKYYLKTSEIFVSNEEYEITTILGSCVSVCLWDRQLKYGGIIHFLLPTWYKNQPESHKYGDFAISDLIKKMYKMGTKLINLQAQIYGGAMIINEGLNIGERNIEIAFKMMNELKIPITKSDTGGFVGRKIVYYNLENKVNLIKFNKRI